MKKNKIFNRGLNILFLLLLSEISICYAQNADFVWAKSMGGSINDVGYSITLDKMNNIYTVGTFSGTADFDPGIGTYNLTSFGSFDMFISKFDSTGNFLWVKQFGGSGLIYGYSITIDTLGYLYVTGSFESTVDFNPNVGTYNLTSSGNKDIFIAKLSSSGNLIWAKSIGGIAHDIGKSICVDTVNSNLLLTGVYGDIVDFNPNTGVYNLTSVGSYDIFVLRFDLDGNLIWAKSIGGTGSDYGNSIGVDKHGNAYITGSFYFTADFDPSINTFNLTSANAEDIFILKLNPSGSLNWAKQFSGPSSYDGGLSIHIDSVGYVYSTGYFNGITDFDPNVNTYNLTWAGSYDIYVSKIDSLGNFIWAKSMGGTGLDYGTSITTDTWGNVITTGYFQNTSNFNLGSNQFNLSSNGSDDIFITKHDALGNFVWAKQMGGTDIDQCKSIITGLNGSIYTTGMYRNNVDFDPGSSSYNLISAGGFDIFVQKLATCIPTSSSISITMCDAYNFNGNLLSVSGAFKDTLINIAGCDSIITLNLTIINSTYSNIIENACDSYNFNGLELSHTGIYMDTVLNSVGCDSIIALHLTIEKSLVNIEEVACNIFNFNGVDLFDSGIYYDTLTNNASCDSIIILNLLIKHATSSNITEISCDSYVAPDGAVYTTSGIKTAVIPNGVGCDSTITIDLTIKSSTTSSITETACDSYTAPDGTVYTTSGIKTVVIPNSVGCDSTITINLTIISSTTSSIIETACDSYTAPDGTVYTTSGIKTAVVPNAAGCDSTITIDLTINIVDVSLTVNDPLITANAVGAIYHWLDCDNAYAIIPNATSQIFTPSVNGNFAVEVTQNFCTDTSACVQILNVGLVTMQISGIVIYPNPVSNELIIEFEGNNKKLNFEILNAIGQVVFKGNLVVKTTVQTSSFAPGVYIIKLENGKNFEFKKIMKE